MFLNVFVIFYILVSSHLLAAGSDNSSGGSSAGGEDVSKSNYTQAISLIKSIPLAKFDETIDISINLNLNIDKSDQSIKGAISLPNGTGKKLRIAVIAKGDKAEDARKSGADIVGDDDLVKMIEKGQTDFDRLISTPDMMSEVGKLGKILGPKGLMPNPKLGTVTSDISSAVKLAKKGQIQFKNDKGGIVHAGIGKISFEKSDLISSIAFN